MNETMLLRTAILNGIDAANESVLAIGNGSATTIVANGSDTIPQRSAATDAPTARWERVFFVVQNVADLVPVDPGEFLVDGHGRGIVPDALNSINWWPQNL